MNHNEILFSQADIANYAEVAPSVISRYIAKHRIMPVQSGVKNEPIHWAAVYGNTNLADQILTAAGEQKEAMLESERDELFQSAADKDHTEFMQWLIIKTPDPTRQSNMLHAKENKPFRTAARRESISVIRLILRLTLPLSQALTNLMDIIQKDLIASGKANTCLAALHSITFLLDNIHDYDLLEKWCQTSASTTLQTPLLGEYLLQAASLCKIGVALQSKGYDAKRTKAMEDLFISTISQREDLNDISLDNTIQSTALVRIYAMKDQYRDDQSLMHLSEVVLPDNAPVYLQSQSFNQHLLAKISFREKLLKEVSSSANPAVSK